MTDLRDASFNNIFTYLWISHPLQAAEGEEVPLDAVADDKGRGGLGAEADEQEQEQELGYGIERSVKTFLGAALNAQSGQELLSGKPKIEL